MLCALWWALLAGFAAPAHAQAISNTASASWTQAGQTFSTLSNTVAFDVAPVAVTIETFAAAASRESLAFTPSHCGNTPIFVGNGEAGVQIIAGVAPASKVRIGDAFYFRVTAAAANLDPAAIDRLETTLITSSGDRETVVIFETAANSGVFVGGVPTAAVPPDARTEDCHLSVATGDTISIVCRQSTDEAVLATAQLDVLADPFGYVFDSEDGSPVDGVRVTLVEAATGQPATVFADDGQTRWPSTVITGEPIVDAAGNRYVLPSGEYRFPLAARGEYRLLIEPPDPYVAPSTASAAQLAGVLRPDGSALTLSPASTGGVLTLNSTEAVRIDVPVDRPGKPVTLSKSASRPRAQPGDLVFYTIVVGNPDSAHAKREVTLRDVPDAALRLRADSLRIDGQPAGDALVTTPDGSAFTLRLGTIPARGRRKVTYAASVRPDAIPGAAQNRVTATDSRGFTAATGAVVQIEEDGLTARMTLVGRVTDGGCAARGTGQGIPGVRVTLEDGSFAVTDAEGRYHFEGLLPGSHVVQVARSTLPEGGRFVDCQRSTNSAGSAISRFVRGQGGSLAVADFHARLPEGARPETRSATVPAAASDQVAAGAEIDWLAQADGPPAFLFPAADHNPRSPSVRVAIRHRADQTVTLTVNGKAADKVSFDGLKLDATRTRGVSLWRGIPLGGETTLLHAEVRNADGTLAADLAREVHFTETPADVEFLPDRSRLVADGRTRPVLALRLVDRHGRPVHAGLSGQFQLSAPYETAETADAQQTRALSGAAVLTPHWTVKGDDGVAYVELAPTMVSGAVQLDFVFPDGQQQPRRRTLKSWMVPGKVEWTLVGLAEGSAGARSIADEMERSGRFDSDLGRDARVAFYAKGRLRGSTLLTLAYDSAKQKADQRLLGAIDPRAYYTIYADASARRFDAASRDKLYVRIESRAFVALFGDFETGFAQTQLARYNRIATGVKAEYDNGRVHAQAFATRVAGRHRRIELQGAGITGPYRLGREAVIPNSEIVVLEVRDRFRSEVIVERRTLTRFLDYDIDLLAGTLTFKQPVLSRDAALNPQFIVVDYDIDPGLAGGGALTAGLRTDWTSRDGRLRLGATGLSEQGDTARTSLGGADLRFRPDARTEVRAETALSTRSGALASAWLVEAERRDGRLSLLAYARSADADFGLGQLNGAETGRRKFGADARVALTSALAVSASAWTDRSLTDGSRREALRVRGEYRTRPADAWIGASAMQDHFADGSAPSSVLLEAGIGRRFLGGKLQVDAATSVGLGGTTAADLPARHQVSASYAVTSWLKLLGTYEIAVGAVEASTARAGFELQPWRGGRVTTALGRQRQGGAGQGEEGRRSFAAFGLSQAWQVDSRLSLDATLDANRILAGSPAARPVNPAQPLASGGHLGGNGTLVEGFTALTLGAGWRTERWSITARAEWRQGELADRHGLTLGAIRQLGEGRMLGAGATWTRATGADGSRSELLDGAVALAWRPAGATMALLSKLELRADTATLGAATTTTDRLALGDLFAAGTAGRSRRVIASLSGNWTPWARQDDTAVQRLELGLFGAVRAKLDGFDDQRIAGTTLLTGLDLRIGLTPRVAIGGSATLRSNLADGTTQVAYGPQVQVVPAKNTVLSLGYTFAGYRDRDFAEARTTRQGVFATLRLKLDGDSLGFLGLGRR
ncbi:DUF11 domain-containing protein [Novosphingobium piscinae]|uniref:DUF11 domain-containing protein n=1 Tax=Novosphingobium piscinae TaxID=1507448 RepID=A0A7X1G036_9SPHN|nr:DUF11 domain-containing protein [Novosphingobium piscinae]MBC2670178.1 DUF11 domain-containing protein [Novosphingobium piscinae]